MPRLVVNPQSGSSWEIQLRPGANLIGRSLTNHFQITDPSVSGTHCEIQVNDGTVQIKDLGSTNGTFVNRLPVTEAVLQPGASVRLGEIELLFCADEPISLASQAPAAASPGFGVPPPVVAPAAVSARGGGSGAGGYRPVQHCRFHQAMAAKYTCAKCGHYFCEACVATRGSGANQQKFCRHCGTECTAVQAQFEAIVEQTFYQRLPSAFLYPLRGGGPMIVIVGIVILGLIKCGQALLIFGTLRTLIFGVILEVFAGGYFFTYLQGIMHATAAEERELPDLPGIGNVLEDIVVPFFRLIALLVFCSLPGAIAGVWYGTSHRPELIYAVYGATALFYLYFPMAFLAVAIIDSITAANPLLVVPSIFRVPVKYLVSLLPLGCMALVQWAGSLFTNKVFPEGWTTGSMGSLFGMIGSLIFLSFLSFYLLVVAVHLLGLIFVTSKSELGWLRK